MARHKRANGAVVQKKNLELSKLSLTDRAVWLAGLLAGALQKKNAQLKISSN